MDAIKDLLDLTGLPSAGVRENLKYFFVAELKSEVNAGEVTGVIGMECSGENVLLRSLAVRPGHRKAGLGAGLVGQALKRAREDGRKEMFLLTNTAEAYLKGLGFKKIERSQIPAPLLDNSALGLACPVCSTCMAMQLC